MHTISDLPTSLAKKKNSSMLTVWNNSRKSENIKQKSTWGLFLSLHIEHFSFLRGLVVYELLSGHFTNIEWVIKGSVNMKLQRDVFESLFTHKMNCCWFICIDLVHLSQSNTPLKAEEQHVLYGQWLQIEWKVIE